MKDLIERLQKATEPDRQIDDAIHDLQPMPKVVEPLRYTRSIDDALTLLPDRWCWRYDSSTFDAEVSDYSGRFLIEADQEWHGANKNPAIAICIAALRARISVERDLTESNNG